MEAIALGYAFVLFVALVALVLKRKDRERKERDFMEHIQRGARNGDVFHRIGSKKKRQYSGLGG